MIKRARNEAHFAEIERALNRPSGWRSRPFRWPIGRTCQSRADTRIDLATVLEQADRITESADCVEQALALYKQKGDLVSSARARAYLADLPPG